MISYKKETEKIELVARPSIRLSPRREVLLERGGLGAANHTGHLKVKNTMDTPNEVPDLGDHSVKTFLP